MRCGTSVLTLGVVVGLACAPPAGAAEPIASAATNWDGVTVHVMSVARRHAVLTVKFAAVNEGDAPQRVWFGFTGKKSCYVVDEESGTKYYVLTDREGNPLASGNDYIEPGVAGVKRRLEPGQTLRVWMKLPAPPPEVTAITIFLNETEPIEDVPITDR